MADIPDYPYFEADKVEVVFGCAMDRFLNVTKGEAGEISRLLPAEATAADQLFTVGYLDGDALKGRACIVDDIEGVRGSITALLASFQPSHQVKMATVAVALHRWFPPVNAE